MSKPITPSEMQAILEMEQRSREAFPRVKRALNGLNDKEAIAILGMVKSDLQTQRTTRQTGKLFKDIMDAVLDVLTADKTNDERKAMQTSLNSKLQTLEKAANGELNEIMHGIIDSEDVDIGVVLASVFDDMRKELTPEFKPLFTVMESGTLPEK